MFNPNVLRVGGAATAAATVCTVTLTAVNGRRLYLSGVSITGLGATGATTVIATITGLVGGTVSLNIAVPAGVGLAIVPLLLTFPEGAAAVDGATNIVVSVPSFGAGNTSVAVSAHGIAT